MTARLKNSCLSALAALSVVTASCTVAHAIEARYACSGGTMLLARFSPPGQAKGFVTLELGTGQVITLPQALSADGGRYAAKDITFWIKGRTATLTRGGNSETCTTP